MVLDIAIGAGGLGFDFYACQIGHGIVFMCLVACCLPFYHKQPIKAYNELATAFSNGTKVNFPSQNLLQHFLQKQKRQISGTNMIGSMISLLLCSCNEKAMELLCAGRNYSLPGP